MTRQVLRTLHNVVYVTVRHERNHVATWVNRFLSQFNQYAAGKWGLQYTSSIPPPPAEHAMHVPPRTPISRALVATLAAAGAEAVHLKVLLAAEATVSWGGTGAPPKLEGVPILGTCGGGTKASTHLQKVLRHSKMSAHLLVQVPGMLADSEPIHACNRNGGICHFYKSPVRITWVAPGQDLCSLGCGFATATATKVNQLVRLSSVYHTSTQRYNRWSGVFLGQRLTRSGGRSPQLDTTLSWAAATTVSTPAKPKCAHCPPFSRRKIGRRQ